MVVTFVQEGMAVKRGEESEREDEGDSYEEIVALLDLFVRVERGCQQVLFPPFIWRIPKYVLHKFILLPRGMQ